MSSLRSQDAWRNHPVFQNRLQHAFPGLKKAVAIFSVYLVVDWTYQKITKPKSTFDPTQLRYTGERGETPSLEE